MLSGICHTLVLRQMAVQKRHVTHICNEYISTYIDTPLQKYTNISWIICCFLLYTIDVRGAGCWGSVLAGLEWNVTGRGSDWSEGVSGSRLVPHVTTFGGLQRVEWWCDKSRSARMISLFRHWSLILPAGWLSPLIEWQDVVGRRQNKNGFLHCAWFLSRPINSVLSPDICRGMVIVFESNHHQAHCFLYHRS